MGLIANIEAQRSKWQQLDLRQLVVQLVKQHAQQVADYNRAQLRAGRNSEGGTLMQYRSRQYAGFKKRMGSEAPEGVADFLLTGAFHKSIFLTVNDKSFSLDARDRKTSLLNERAGNSIFGLTGENIKNVWVEILRPPLLPIIKQMV